MMVRRYIAKARENITVVQRFSADYDDHYRKKMSEARLEQFYKEDDEIFFMISQPAPSLTIKRHATGGKLRLDDKGELKDYEEIFRTWKMDPDTLKVRSYFLFEKMVNNEPLEPYYSSKKGDQFIEFPDDLTFYDKSSRSWKTRQ